jgi:hypothetical protein
MVPEGRASNKEDSKFTGLRLVWTWRIQDQEGGNVAGPTQERRRGQQEAEQAMESRDHLAAEYTDLGVDSGRREQGTVLHGSR